MDKAVILSPHFDDAVLNCWQLLSESSALVLNIFSGVPPKGTHRFWDLVCGTADSHKMMQKRRRENEAAISLSGSHAQLYLDYLEAQYRQRQPAVNVNNLAADILELAPAGAVFLAPLAAGRLRRHADHVLLRRAAMQLLVQGHKVSFYPDAPYMNLPRLPRKQALKRLERRASQVLSSDVTLQINELTPEQRAAKLRAMQTYQTQYKMTNLFSFGGLRRLARREYEVVIEPQAGSGF